MSLTQLQTQEQAHIEPYPKRQRVIATSSPATAQAPRRRSRVFAPYRTIGLISPTPVPFTSVSLGATTFQITTSTGNSLQTYDLRKGLNLVFITKPSTPEAITASIAWKNVVLAAWGGKDVSSKSAVWIFRRGKQIGELEVPKSSWGSPISSLVVFGSWIVGCSLKSVLVWKLSTCELYTTLSSPEVSRNSSATNYTGCLTTVQTYLNKVFIGRQDGSVEIWNVATGKLLYTIYAHSSHYGAVTSLEPAPAVSLLAIGYQNGQIVIQDIRKDKAMLTLNKEGLQDMAVKSMSFRSDGLGAGVDGKEAGVLAAAFKGSNDVAFWDLNKGARRMGILRNAHRSGRGEQLSNSSGINRVEFLTGQAILVTTGSDNALRTWVFDEIPFSPIPRILHFRSGHAAPVSTLQFLPPDAEGADTNGKWIMSGSLDRSFWGWSLRRDGQSTELSQGSIQKKAKKLGLGSGKSSGPESLKVPPITCMACSLNRDGGMGALPGKHAIWGNTRGKNAKGAGETNLSGWESVVTGHEGDRYARTWFWGRKRAGRWALETTDGKAVSSVAITQCGTFALVGSAGGIIDMYNLQSGYHRQRYPAKLTPGQAKMMKLQKHSTTQKVNGVHTQSNKVVDVHKFNASNVTGVAVDNINRTVISCLRSGIVKFYHFATGRLDTEIDWQAKCQILSMRFHRPNDLIALACDDACVRVVDIDTRKPIRELRGCTGTIIDLCFSNDGRWVIATSTDRIVRVWDLPTGHLIDAIRFRHQCTSLAFSNTGDYLATAHDNTNGIHLWTNRALFAQVPTRHISRDDVAEIDAPAPSGENGQGVVASTVDENDEDDRYLDLSSGAAPPVVDQLSGDLQTLSLVPRARWQTLLHLDVIRQRNKPIEPPKPPEQAPFFLSAIQSSRTDTNSTNTATNQKETSSSIKTNINKNNENNTSSRVQKLNNPTDRTQSLTILLRPNTSSTPSNLDDPSSCYTPLIEHLKSLTPSAADLAIRSLDTRPPFTELITFVDALLSRLRARRDYELVQAWMAVFLKIHGDVLNADDRLVDAVRRWRDESVKERARIEGLVGYCAGVLAFVKGER